ncbi:MAG TPA: hypothetical protein VMV18_05700, partial [bacterium]|nr:hypothetical protein [bacterium]
DEETWKTLGVTLPYPASHVFSAQVGPKGNLILRAEGNLDGDGWLDRWHLDTLEPARPETPMQDSSDAVDRDLDGATQDYWPSSPER